MCNTATVAQLLNGVITTVGTFGQIENLTADAAFEQIETELRAVETDVQNWKKGDPAQEFIQVLTDVEAGFKLLPVPVEDKEIADAVLAGISGVIGILDYNGTPTTTTGATPSDEEIKTHQAEVLASTTSKVHDYAPSFHYRKGFIGLFKENPEHAYFDYWNEVTKQHGEKWASAHVNY